jgi:hypothetical protein
MTPRPAGKLSNAEVIAQVTGGDEPEDKLHLHGRLSQPAQGKEGLARLKTARELVAQLVGATERDMSTHDVPISPTQ